ncbi:MAG: hypothetical protein J6D08_07315 [Lachnospiraceae bacterium]|nr:hypothetical protein [Lachnospiraceae bacterium]
MFTEVQLLSYLITLGAETASTVKELTDGTVLAVYEGTPSAENNARVMENYEKALEACRVWLRAVLGVEAIDNHKADISAEVTLFLPDRLLEASIYTSELPFGGENKSIHTEKLTTPIGIMDYFTYRAILEVPNNPVQLLYRYFQDLIHQMHNITSMPFHCDGQDDLLNKYIVEDEGISDVLGVHQYDSLWYNIDEFLSDRFSGNEVS